MSRYPAPDRSNIIPDPDDDEPDKELWSYQDVFADGRPYRVEVWANYGTTFITCFFSERDLEKAAPTELLELVGPVIEKEGIPPKFRKLETSEVHVIEDANQNRMYSLTFTVGEPQ